MNNNLVRVWALLLISCGLCITAYKCHFIGFPLSQQESTPVWTVQAQVSFKGNGGPTKVNFDLPAKTPGYYVTDEDFISGKYGLTIDTVKENRKAHWAVRRARGEQRLYYRITVAQNENNASWDQSSPPFPKIPVYEEPYDSAVKAILNDVRTASADVATFTQELLNRLNSDTTDENIELIRDKANNTDQWTSEIINTLKGVRIPARKVWGFNLNNAANDLYLTPKLQVHNGKEWITFDPNTSEMGIPERFLVWKIGEKPKAELPEGQQASVRFSVTRTYANLLDVVRKSSEHKDSFFISNSLLNLPIQTQNTYRLLLMIPIGALVVVFMRTYIGLNTFGTFMPVLIALSFRETQLGWGVLAFTLIVSIGLMIRSYFERLMLLLVPRLAAILIVVVILMLIISLVTSQLNVERLLSVSLFPMVILAMTIERMSIVLEENGFQTAFYQGVGSLITAVVGYLLMTNESISYALFVFPELLLSALGLCLWTGKYTGYRLSELVRFRDILQLDAKREENTKREENDKHDDNTVDSVKENAKQDGQ